MNAIIISISIVLIMIGAIFSESKNTKPNFTPPPTINVLSADTTSVPSPTPVETPNTPAVKQQVSDISKLIYPKSILLSSTETKMLLESGSDPASITDWYEKEIKSQGFTSVSFAKTAVNSNILNKLSGAKTGKKIEVTIQKSDTDTQTKIEVIF
ncbi:MAG TPA: hypothetical protein VFI61_01160 [Patescibacteria group bacterium]|nr:hypothetical protein [Patescibacteria group bacterium]